MQNSSENYCIYYLATYLTWCRGALVSNTAQLYSTKSVLRFCAGLNPVRGVLEI